MDRYKIIPGLLLAFYALCTVCPDRIVPAVATQLAAASEAHDCHNREKRKPELSLPQHALSLAFGPALPLRTIHFSTAGPPIASLKINLRI
jgi:hypothetical protein